MNAWWKRFRSRPDFHRWVFLPTLPVLALIVYLFRENIAGYDILIAIAYVPFIWWFLVQEEKLPEKNKQQLDRDERS